MQDIGIPVAILLIHMGGCGNRDRCFQITQLSLLPDGLLGWHCLLRPITQSSAKINLPERAAQKPTVSNIP
jgi:hypothetical protein